MNWIRGKHMLQTHTSLLKFKGWFGDKLYFSIGRIFELKFSAKEVEQMCDLQEWTQHTIV
jgi:hypothetical protein